MKKITLVLIIAIMVLSCTKEAPVDYAIISGKIENVDFEKVIISKAFQKYAKEIELNEDGSFSDTIRTNQGRYTIYEVEGKNSTNVYFEKGDKIHIAYDAKDHKNTLTFTGKGSEASAYLVKDANRRQESYKNKTGYELIDSTYTIAATKELVKKVKAASLAILNAEKGLSKGFIAQEKRKINAIGTSVVMDQRINIGGVKKMMTTLEFPEDFFTELAAEVDWDNFQDSEDLIPIMRMQGFYISANGFKIAKEKNIARERGIIEFVKTSFKNKKIKEGLLLDSYSSLMRDSDDITSIYNEFMALDLSEEIKSDFKKAYDVIFPISTGQPSPKFENYENFAGGTTSLDDFKGKYVYIDLWATWCGPCKDEIPALKVLEKEYHDKNIAFVSISCDQQKTKPLWKKMVKDLDLTGVQLITDNDFNTPFVRAYNATSIPRFILINPEGKIVKNKAPRPSETEKIKALFNSLSL